MGVEKLEDENMGSKKLLKLAELSQIPQRI
jgi:hypothetical protein